MVHVVIIGATGFAGKHVLLDALRENRITKVTVVGRHAPSIEAPDMALIRKAIVDKLTIVQRDDLGACWDYDSTEPQHAELRERLADVVACIWCIGGKANSFATEKEFERVCHGFTMRAARFFSRVASVENAGKAHKSGRASQPFRFVYLSGKFADRSGKAHQGWITVEAQTRNMKGRTERELLELASHTLSTPLASPAPESQTSSLPAPTEEKPPAEPSEAVEPPPISDEPPAYSEEPPSSPPQSKSPPPQPISTSSASVPTTSTTSLTSTSSTTPRNPIPSHPLTVLVFRPGGIIAGKTVRSLGGLTGLFAEQALQRAPSVVIHVERVARVLVDAAIGVRVEWQRDAHGKKKDTWESEEMVSWSVGLGV